MEQAFDRDSLQVLRAAVAAYVTQAGVPPCRIVDLVLVVHELAANAVFHGAGHGRVRIWRRGHAVHCEVTDDGRPESSAVSRAARPGPGTGRAETAAPWAAEDGHGLWVVGQLAEHAAIRCGPHGTTVAVRIAVSPAGS
ncbi:MAG TPA: ATP-binding protein [Streptosporangiaceae bacterium]